MNFKIRPAVFEDAHAIARVHIESWKSTYAGIVPDAFLASLKLEDRLEMWQKALSQARPSTFVAEAQCELAGFLTGGPAREPVEGYCGEVYALYSLSHYQRQGIGRALVASFVSELLKEGCGSMLVWVLERNPAVSFYQRLGGVLIGKKHIEIGGAQLDELCLGWQSIASLILNG